jgi:hypothetical protein
VSWGDPTGGEGSLRRLDCHALGRIGSRGIGD